MTGIQLEKDKVIYAAGQPMTALHLITKGKVRVSYPGGEYVIGKGDCIGICEVCSEVHFLGYHTAEDVTILTYPLTTMESLNDLLQKHPDVAGLFIISAFHQINTLLNHCDVSELSCNNLYQDLQNDYETYCTLCERYHIPQRTLEGLDDFSAYLGEELPDMWLNGYYLGLLHIFTAGNARTFVQEPAVSLGLIRKASLDFRKTYASLEEQFHYQQSLSQYVFSKSGNDLFDFLTTLYYKIGDSPDADELYADINRIILQAESLSCLEDELLKKRTENFQNKVACLHEKDSPSVRDEGQESILKELAGSLNVILDYAGTDLETSTSFRQHVYSYKCLEDKASMEDDACALRRSLTEEFYTIYSVTFAKTLETPDIPLPVKMFLYFGYVDEELAGPAACSCLYSLAKNIKISENQAYGVYTFYDWLLAIFEGKKEPSRNEFDQDYSDFIHKQKLGGNISNIELRALENNAMGKVTYELRNMFPQVNKMTYGRIATFCPVFSADDCLKELPSCYVTAEAVGKAIERIRKVDYTAYYRETMDMEHLDILGKEFIHVEYLPDVILMPNVGIRGVMWQEIEGKKRSSSSRMIFSIFHMEDLNTSMIRLTGEYRWEICKRIQGGRWNDVSEKSLTSEYFDYIQFYRKNRELTTEAKERVRLSLQRAKNSFKEMFVRDYLIWVLFEGTGSPRLNKVARSILFTYCPFTSEICGVLEQNPLYSELLNRRRILVAQRVHHLDMLIQKLRNGGIQVPDTIEDEKKFAEG